MGRRTTRNVPSGHVFCWPKNKPRRIVTLEGARWLSLGLEFSGVGEGDVFQMLPLPALHQLDGDSDAFLESWLRQIVEVRNRLTQTTPEHQQVAAYFHAVDQLAVSPPYDTWVNRVVSERPSYLDVIENGLARAIIAWCWNLWGSTDLSYALLHRAPSWLKIAIDRIRENPAVSVSELAHATGFSPAQFRRCFQLETGLAPRDYLQRQRLEVARRLLETTELPVATISAQIGFASVPHFVQLWKQKTGLPPLQYRLSQKEAQL